MHENNCFVTLTYSDEHLESPKLVYADFQKFAKRLRRSLGNEHRIGYFVTGEYGDGKRRPSHQRCGKTRDGTPVPNRPHWHAIIFNYAPTDRVLNRTNDRGDHIFTSSTLDKLWGKGRTEFGSVTFESAGYVARYAAKKLTFGHDGHEFQPISKKSSKQAIGRSFLEKYWTDVFNTGKILLIDGTETQIPRYYEKWLKEHHFDAWTDYIQTIKFSAAERSEKKKLAKIEELKENSERRIAIGNFHPETTEAEASKRITKARYDILMSHLKGEI
ncbi:MAG: replication initiator protein [Microvirus sp.]|nr:MAG: replication initiator protein [Microvirus sp.]